ncbi:MarR family transcriptional regulator [Achromobacter marplatensis]|uniref:MarR family transcriptional regulator n=1 Tax=Achromobacter marplatensis TaxID=470868 RepID=A0AA43B1X5_9BURK|nr:MarR family transcriptional regulator [Achromobacter marplatensis]MDH2051184.1 MarR family transcriptional regulator [Achromobacter marplatensis]
MSTEQVSPEQIESTRKIGNRLRKEIGDAVAAFTQTRAAEFMETSASTVSRIVASDLDGVCHLMAALGLQFASLDAMVVSKAQIEAYEQFAYEYLRPKVEARRRG